MDFEFSVFLNDLHSYYLNGLQGNIFTAYLTLVSILIAVKAFVIVEMKRSVYDDPYYWMKYSSEEKDIYRPLRNLKCLLFYSIVLCLLGALIQATIGNISFYYCVLFTLAYNTVAFIVVVLILIIINRNLKDLIDHHEEKRKNSHLMERANELYKR